MPWPLPAGGCCLTAPKLRVALARPCAQARLPPCSGMLPLGTALPPHKLFGAGLLGAGPGALAGAATTCRGRSAFRHALVSLSLCATAKGLAQKTPGRCTGQGQSGKVQQSPSSCVTQTPHPAPHCRHRFTPLTPAHRLLPLAQHDEASEHQPAHHPAGTLQIPPKENQHILILSTEVTTGQQLKHPTNSSGQGHRAHIKPATKAPLSAHSPWGPTLCPGPHGAPHRLLACSSAPPHHLQPLLLTPLSRRARESCHKAGRKCRWAQELPRHRGTKPRLVSTVHPLPSSTHCRPPRSGGTAHWRA